VDSGISSKTQREGLSGYWRFTGRDHGRNQKGAPALFRKLPLEWLHRLIIDPKRIRRQAVIPYFLFKVFTQKRGTYPSTDYPSETGK